MPVGLLTLELHIPDAQSLKDKRQVLRSLKDGCGGNFNVAVAELEHQDTWQRSVVGVVTLSNEEKHVKEVLQKVLDEADRILGSIFDQPGDRNYLESVSGTQMSPANHRHERVGEEIAHEINAMLAGELKDPRLEGMRDRQRSARSAGHEARARVHQREGHRTKSRPTRSRRSSMLPDSSAANWSSGCSFGACRNCISRWTSRRNTSSASSSCLKEVKKDKPAAP